MNYKRYVLLFNIFFLLLLFAATMLFDWRPGIAGVNFRRLDILSDVIKPPANKYIVKRDKTNIKIPVSIQRDYRTYAGLVNTSGQPGALFDFISRLYELKQRKRKKIRIAYFGDSMIEGDQITKDLRSQLQQFFGGSGVGFVPVTSVSASFRQTVTHYFSSNWEDVSYNSGNRKTADLFLSGHSYFTRNNSTVTYKPVKQPGLDSFSNVLVLYGSPVDSSNANANIMLNERSFPVVAKSAMNMLDTKTTNPKEVKVSISSANIPLYGAAFEGDSGIVLDNFSFRGISGVELNYFTPEYLKKVQETRPYDLMIFHFGPNLLSDPNMTNFKWYTKKMQPVLQKIREALPQINILLISTADKAYNYDGSWHTEKGVLPLIDAQYSMASSVGASFFNLYNAMGGEDAMVKWVTGDTVLARRDFTHPNNIGAQKFADLISTAIMNEYKEYEKNYNK